MGKWAAADMSCTEAYPDGNSPSTGALEITKNAIIEFDGSCSISNPIKKGTTWEFDEKCNVETDPNGFIKQHWFMNIDKDRMLAVTLESNALPSSFTLKRCDKFSSGNANVTADAQRPPDGLTDAPAQEQNNADPCDAQCQVVERQCPGTRAKIGAIMNNINGATQNLSELDKVEQIIQGCKMLVRQKSQYEEILNIVRECKEGGAVGTAYLENAFRISSQMLDSNYSTYCN